MKFAPSGKILRTPMIDDIGQIYSIVIMIFHQIYSMNRFYLHEVSLHEVESVCTPIGNMAFVAL